jgi:hypothetical protein
VSVAAVLPALCVVTRDVDAHPGGFRLAAGDVVCDVYGLRAEPGGDLRVDRIDGEYGWIPRDALAPADIPDAERLRWWLAQRRRAYRRTAPEQPKCRICGDRLVIGSMGPDGVEWHCAAGDWTGAGGSFVNKPGRGPGLTDEHMSRSAEHFYPRQLGDADGIALVDLVESLAAAPSGR